MTIWRCATTVLLFLSLAGGASALQLRAPNVGRGGGLLGDDSARLQARDLGRRLGLPCVIGQVKYRGLTQTNAATFEVVCDEGGGYVLIDDPENRMVDCVALERGPPASACRLPGATDVTAAVRRHAASAGLTCTVDEGRAVGLSENGGLIYEAGCRGQAGAWLSAGADGWNAVDCLRVEARGDRCSLTTDAERLTSLAAWVTAASCSPRAYRYMGESSQNTLYELTCVGGDGYVVRLDPANRLQESVPCERASHIGDGCRLRRNVESSVD